MRSSLGGTRECLLELGFRTKQEVIGEKLEGDHGELPGVFCCTGRDEKGDWNWGSKERRGVQQAFLVF